MNQADRDIITKVKIKGAEDTLSAIQKLKADLEKLNNKNGDTPPVPPAS